MLVQDGIPSCAGSLVRHLPRTPRCRGPSQGCRRALSQRNCKAPCERAVEPRPALLFGVCHSVCVLPSVNGSERDRTTKTFLAKGLLQGAISSTMASSRWGRRRRPYRVLSSAYSIACCRTPRPTPHFKTRSIGSTLKVRIHVPLRTIATCII